MLNVSDLEWKLIYVGSAESSDYDQILDSVLVGPVPGGRHKFVFQVIYFYNCTDNKQLLNEVEWDMRNY